jgi:hypothetical protein
MIATPILVVIAILVLYLLNSIKILREYERGVIFRLGRALPVPKGPGIIFVFRPFDQIVRISLAAGCAGSSAAGHHHARQRHLEGECGGDALRGQPQRRRHQGGQLRLPDLAVCADHAALSAWARWNWTRCSAIATS